MSTYTYHGEAELLVPFTLDGPRVLEAGDEVRLLDSDTSLDAHPLFTKDGADTPHPPAPAQPQQAAQEPAQAAPAPTPAPTPAPAPEPASEAVSEPAQTPEPNPASDPEQAPETPAEPTA